MITEASAERSPTMTFPRVLDAPKIIVGAAYLSAFALLDWISFIEPYAHLGITPWNPGIGLSFVLMLLFGRSMFPFLLVSPVIADLLHQQFAMPWHLEILSSILIGGGYALALLILMRPKLGFDPALSSMRDLFFLMLVAVISAAIVACSYVALTVAAGLLPMPEFGAAVLRYLIGDV